MAPVWVSNKTTKPGTRRYVLLYRFEITQKMLDDATAAGVTGGINARFDIDHGFDGTGVYWGRKSGSISWRP